MKVTKPKQDQIIALVDCNNFYVSCERVFNPKLEHVPVAVLSNNDGCIVSRSNEVKAMRLPIGTPIYQCERMIRSKGGAMLSSNYTLYADMSQRVMQALAEFCPDLEIYSIDEAFLHLTAFRDRDLVEYCRLIRQKVKQWTGIPVSIGIANTKTLAKIANKVAKKYKGYQGVFDMCNHPKIEDVLASIPVEDVWGVGWQYEKLLRNCKINNALELRNADERFIEQYMTMVGHKTVLELRGYACIEMDDVSTPKKGIVTSRSFCKQVTSLSEIQEAVASYTTRAAEKLRAQHSVAGHLTVFLNTNRFKDGPQYNSAKSTTLFPPTAYTPDLIREAMVLLENTYQAGFEYKKAGVMLANIIQEEDVPLTIFETCYLDDDRKQVMDAVDKLNHKYGQDTVFYAQSGTVKDWSMRRARLSPRYTTRWSDIPVVS